MSGEESVEVPPKIQEKGHINPLYFMANQFYQLYYVLSLDSQKKT